MDDITNLPPPEFPGLVGGQLPPGATRTGFIPAAANLATGDRFSFVITGVRTQGQYVKLGDVTPDMQGSRVAVTAPATFFQAHAGEQLKAFYVVEHASGEAAYSADTLFVAGSGTGLPATARTWFTATFDEFYKANTYLPARLAFYSQTQTTFLQTNYASSPPYATGTACPAYYGMPNLKLDFPARRVRLGIQVAPYAVTVQLLDVSGNVLISEQVTKSGWFDKIVDSGGIDSIKLTTGSQSYISYVGSITVFPNRPDNPTTAHLSENFNGIPLDDGIADTRLLPAWRVSAALSRIAVESVGPASDHFLVIDQKIDNAIREKIHYFSPRIAYGPARLAIVLRCQSGTSLSVRVIAMYEKYANTMNSDSPSPEATDDVPRYVSKTILLGASVQTVELGGALSDEFLSCVYIAQEAKVANVIFYDEIIAI